MIMTDSKYIKSNDINAGRTYKKKEIINYFGSTAYWMNKLKNALGSDDKSNLKEIIKCAVTAVDIENSTHINSDGVGREELSDRIFEKVDDLIGILSDVNTGINFINYLSKPTSVKDNKHKARKNLSFASKFVHYACFYFFEKDDIKRDNFSIYDSVLKKGVTNLY